ncbi:hypothetical protein Tco_0607665 [Tanacetum coccineum]
MGYNNLRTRKVVDVIDFIGDILKMMIRCSSEGSGGGDGIPKYLIQGVLVLVTISHRQTNAIIRRLTSFLPFRLDGNLFRHTFRNDMFCTFPTFATVVFGRLDSVDSLITSSCVDWAFELRNEKLFSHLTRIMLNREASFVSWCGDL